MSFLHPFYFWIMLGLIPLIAVYFLKVRPRKKPTTAFFLWQRLFDQKRSTSLFQKLRDLLSLLLMLLAFVSIVLALTAPVLNNEQSKSMLIIIDNSASMSTKGKSGTRLDQAKSLAKDIIRSLNQNQLAAVAEVSLDIRYLSHFTASPRTLIDAVSQIEPSDCPFKEKILISSLAYRNISSDPNTNYTMSRMVSDDYRILLISDGCGIDGNLPDFVELFKVGAKSDNLGLIACDLQRIDAASMDGSAQKEQLELYFQIASSADETIQTDLLVQYGPNRITKKLIPIEIQPGINKPEHYTITNEQSDNSAIDSEQAGLWTVQIDYDDSLDKDNIAYIAVPPKHPIRVEVDSNDSYFFKHSVLAFSQTSNDLVLVDSQPDIILTDGMPSRQGCSVVFSPDSSDGWWGSAGKPVEKILPHIIIKDHPLLEHCDIEAIPFVGAREVNLPEDSLVLVENEDHIPLIYRVRSEENSAVIINMNLKDSDFYYSAWFPVIIYNAAKNLTGKSDRIASSYPIGSVVPVPLLQDSDSPLAVRYSWESITDISTENKLLHNSESEINNNDSQFIIRKLGYYSISNTSGKVHVGSGLFNKSQTMVNNDILDTSLAINRGMPPSFFLSILALIVLLIESMLYHRRKAG